MSQNQKEYVPLSKKRLPKVIVVVVLLVIGFLVALPHVIRYNLERWLVNNGAQSAEIQKVRLNLFTGTASLDGMKVKLDDDVVLGDDNIHLDIGLSSLFKKEGHLETGKLSGLIVDIELSPDGTLRIGSISPPPSSAEPVEPVESRVTGWLFRIGYMELENCQVRFTMPKLHKTIHIDHAVLRNVTTGISSQPSHLELQGNVNDTPLTIELDRIDLNPELIVNGHIKIDGYNLAYLHELLQDVLNPFNGMVMLDGNILFSLSDQGDIAAKYDGSIGVDQGDIGKSNFSTKSPLISYNGMVQYEQNTNSDIEINVDGLLDGKSINLSVPGAHLDLVEKQLRFDGKTHVTITNGDIGVATDVGLSLTNLNLDLPPLNVTHSGLQWQGHVEYELVGNSGNQIVSTNGELALKKPAYGLESNDFSMHTDATQLSWQGKIDYLLSENKTSNVLLNGTLKGTELEFLLENQKIHIKQQDLNLTTEKVSLKTGEQVQLGGKASLQADNLEVASDGSSLLQLEKSAANTLTFTADGGLQVDTVTLTNLDVLATSAQPLTASVPEITLKDLVSTDFTEATADSLQIKQPTVHDTKKKSLLAELETITGSTLKVDQSAKLSLASISTGKGSFLKKDGKNEKPQITLGNLHMKEVAWSSDDGFFCDKIEVDSLFADYTKIKSPESKSKKTEPAQQKEEGKKPLPAIQINNIAVTGNSGFKFADKSTTTAPFLTTLILETAEIQNINSSKPEIPFTYKIKGKFDKYAPLDISGTCSPFADKLLVESKIHLRNYALQQVSPYVVDAIGTQFVSGQMNLTSELKITGDKLDMDNNLVFQQIKAETVRKEVQDKLNNELPVSLDMALSMLRDKNGDIDIDVPVSGTLSDLSVNPTDIIVTALSKALTVSLTPYLAYTVLGPAGALAYVGMKAGQAVIDTNLPVLEFENGASELTDAHKEQLKDIGKRIEDDKDKDYSICPRVLLWELSGNVERNFASQQKILEDEPARKELLAIAGARAENVQNYLLKNFSIDKDHLLICSPTINFEPDGKSSISFRK